MNEARRTYIPNSNWISAALLTLFVVSFGLFANAHTQDAVAQPEVTANFCATENSSTKTRTLFRYY